MHDLMYVGFLLRHLRTIKDNDIFYERGQIGSKTLHNLGKCRRVRVDCSFRLLSCLAFHFKRSSSDFDFRRESSLINLLKWFLRHEMRRHSGCVVAVDWTVSCYGKATTKAS